MYGMIEYIHKGPKYGINILVIALMLLGGILRIMFLGSVPGGMHQDEAFVAWNAFAMLKEGMDSAGHHFPVYMADWGDGHSALYVWLLMPVFALVKGNITPALCRIPQVFISIMTLWTTFCLLKRLKDFRTGLWGLFLLTICPWHIMMSRWGLDANLAPGFLIFGLYFFVRGIEQEKFLPLSGFFYGLSLYSYAMVWPVVPFILLLQISYCIYHKKIRLNGWCLLSALILFFMALPLLLFVLVNSQILPEIRLFFLTIPKMEGYRGAEIVLCPEQMWKNLRNTLKILICQNTGSPYDFLLPWGLFYDIGRIFIVIGAIALLVRLFNSLGKKEFVSDYFLFAQLAGGVLCGILITAKMHQINCLYIPLVLCEAYGVQTILKILRKKTIVLEHMASWGLITLYLICLSLFQKDYYTIYRQTAGAYFGEGIEECVEYALEQCEQKGIHTITTEKGAQWPRLLLYTQTLPSEYLSSVVYDIPPAPASFNSGQIHINTRIDYSNLSQESIYIIYFTDISLFEMNFTLKGFQDWYVAVPVSQ